MPSLNPARESEVLAELGLTELPKPRFEAPKDLPKIPKEFRPKFWESMQLIDSLESAAFERFIPPECAVDLGIDPYVRDPELSFAILVRTDLPPPVDNRLAAAMGVGRWRDPSEWGRVRYAMLASDLRFQYEYLGASSMSRPLVFRAGAPRRAIPGYHNRGRPRARTHWPIPFVGIHCKVVVKVASGLTRDDMKAGLGLLMPKKKSDWFGPAAGDSLTTDVETAQSDSAPTEE